MRTGRQRVAIVLTDEERAHLKSIAGSRSLPHGLVTRAQIIILSADGMIPPIAS